jgi:DNA-binding response OmpR family regulator
VMPVMDGLTALKTLREGGQQVPVIVVTGAEDLDTEILVRKLGAQGVLRKPFEPHEVEQAVQRALTA